LGISEKALGSDHPHVAYHLVGLADVLLAQRSPAEAVAFAERAVTIREGGDVPAAEVAEAKFLLARALVVAGESMPRAVALAEQARDAYSDAGEARGEALAEVERWLRRPAAAPPPHSR
jgi:hypothetical protein